MLKTSSRKDYERAIEDYTQVIALDPNYAKAYYNRGLTKDEFEKLSRGDRGLHSSDRALIPTMLFLTT